MKCKHVNFASKKQSTFVCKLMCLIMAIMLLSLMIPHGLAFAGNNANAKEAETLNDNTGEVQTAFITDNVSDESVSNLMVTGTVKFGEDIVHDGGMIYCIAASISGEYKYLSGEIENNGTFKIDGVPNDLTTGILVVCATSFVTTFDYIYAGHTDNIDVKVEEKGVNVAFSCDPYESIDEYYLTESSKLVYKGKEYPLGGFSFGKEVPKIAVPFGSSFKIDDEGALEYCSGDTSGDYLETHLFAQQYDGAVWSGWYKDGKLFDKSKTWVVDEMDKQFTHQFIATCGRPVPVENPVVSGHVTSDYGLMPVANAEVYFAADESNVYSVQTDEYGYYSRELPAGKIWVGSAFAEGYTFDVVYVNDGQPVDASIDNVDFDLVRAIPSHFEQDGHIDKFKVTLYLNEDENNADEENYKYEFETTELPDVGILPGTHITTLGGIAVCYSQTIPSIGDVDVTLECICENDNPYIPYWCFVNGRELEPWEEYTVESWKDEFNVDFVTIPAGYIDVSSESEGHSYFYENTKVNDQDFYDEEVISEDDLKLARGNYFYIAEDQETLVASHVHEWAAYDVNRETTITPVAKPGFKFDHWELDGEVFDQDSFAVLDFLDYLDFEAVYVPVDKPVPVPVPDKGDKQDTHFVNGGGIAQTGDALPFALVGGICLIALASLGVTLYSRKRFDT